MTKPVIVTRLGKGSELTFQEGDDNFSNLRNATVTVAGDSGTAQAIDLNGTVTVSGGTGLSTAMTTGTVTVNLDNTAVTAGSYTKASVTIDAQGRVTAASNGSADFATADARTAISVTDAGGDGSLAYNNTTGVMTYTGPSAAEVRAHISAGTGISITDGAIATTITQYTDSAARSAVSATDAGGEGSFSYNSGTGVFTYTGPSFSGLEVTSAKNQNNGYAGLDAGGKVASAQLPSYVDDVVEYAAQANFPATGETSKIYVALDNNKIYRWSGSAYVEISASPGSTDSVTEGSTNLYFTTQRARDAFSQSTGITITNGAIATTITQYTDAGARAAVSVTDAGGDGSLAYNSSTGVFTYTGPSAAEVRAHFSGSTGISITDGAISSTITQYADSNARSAISVTDAGGDGSLGYNSSTGVITYTGPGTTEYRAAFTAGTGITISSGVIASTVSDTNTTYGISAETATGGVNLRLTGSDASTDDVKLAQGSNITLTRTDANTITIAGSASGLTDVVNDTTPQLGGNLDVNGQSIVSVSNGNIAITPNGTGEIVLGNTSLSKYKETVFSLTYGATITPNWNNGSVQKVTLTGNVTFAAPTNMVAGSSLTFIIVQDATGSRTGTWNGSYIFAGGAPTLTTTANAVDVVNVFYDGSLYLSSISKQDNSSTVTGLAINAQGELRLADSDSSNYVGFKSPATVTTNKIWTLPAADGTANQVLATDGAGNLSFATASGGGSVAFAQVRSNYGSVAVTSASYSAPTFSGNSSEAFDPSSIVSGGTNATNDLTLIAGTYIIIATLTGSLQSGSANSPHRWYAKLYNNTSSQDIVVQEYHNDYDNDFRASTTGGRTPFSMTLTGYVSSASSMNIRMLFAGVASGTTTVRLEPSDGFAVMFNFIKIA